MLNARPILKFLILFVLSYAILIAVSPLLHNQTGSYLKSFGNTFLHSPIHNGLVSFYKTKEKLDIEMRIGNISKHVNGVVPSLKVKFGSSSFLYLPLALLLALIIASPIPLKRKLLSLAIELLLLHLLVLFRIYIYILYVCTINSWLELLTPGPFIKKFIDWMYFNFVDYGTTFLLVIVLIWLAVTFRKEDLSLLRVKSKKQVSESRP